MALIWADSFAYYNTATANQNGYISGNSTYYSSGGRLNDGYLSLHATGLGSALVTRAFTATSTLVTGFALRRDVDTVATHVMGFSNASGWCFQLFDDGAGHLYIKQADGTTVWTDSATTVMNTWYYLEIKVTSFNTTTGNLTFRRDGVPIATLTNIKTTNNNGNANWANVQLAGNSAYHSYSAWYVCDTSGTKNNDFLGDVRVIRLRPNADGAHTDWTPDSGTTHYTQVDDLTPDGEATYVSSSTLNAIDTYAISDLPISSGTVAGVIPSIYVEKAGGGVRAAAPVVRMGTSDYVGTPVNLTLGYVFASEVLENRPSDNGDWTITDVADMEIGVKVTT